MCRQGKVQFAREIEIQENDNHDCEHNEIENYTGIPDHEDLYDPYILEASVSVPSPTNRAIHACSP